MVSEVEEAEEKACTTNSLLDRLGLEGVERARVLAFFDRKAVRTISVSLAQLVLGSVASIDDGRSSRDDFVAALAQYFKTEPSELQQLVDDFFAGHPAPDLAE